ncbi:hypothetical protein CDL15_Pgr013023 [Punica granatum]|uniref:Uncharacterized protein n=1 Tax=Punica granatum TaxID=22663 RepID=A0A218XGT4_PUNGR|nr:hypothetical protein CDL15_Pgr013023 [Punica granatum]
MHAESEIESSVPIVSASPPPEATGDSAAKASPPHWEDVIAPTAKADADDVNSASNLSTLYASIDLLGRDVLNQIITQRLIFLPY